MAQLLVDLLLITMSIFITFPLWHRVYKHLPHYAQLTLGMRMYRLFCEGLVIIIFGIMLAGSFLFIAREFGDCLAGWRFGMLSFILSAIVVLLIEVIAAVSDTAANAAERLTTKFSKPRSRFSDPKPRLPKMRAPE